MGICYNCNRKLWGNHKIILVNKLDNLPRVFHKYCAYEVILHNRDFWRAPLDLLIKFYPKNTAIIRYRIKTTGRIHDWPIGASGQETEEGLRCHLAEHMPDTEFIDYIIK